MEKHPEGTKYVVFKKDFFYTVAKLAVLITLIINGMTLYGHSRLNVPSIVMTLFVVMMCLLSGISFVIVDGKKHFDISGYELSEENVKDIKIKEHKMRLSCTILFNEEINGYQGMEFYLFGKDKQKFIDQIEQM